jgi:very-short-patch-repair endonuclease
MLAIVRSAGLPEPIFNQHAHGYEIDVLWPEHRVAVEVDGYEFHGGRGSFEFDRRKSADLQAAGLTLVRFTARQLRQEPLFVAARLGQVLAAADG